MDKPTPVTAPCMVVRLTSEKGNGFKNRVNGSSKAESIFFAAASEKKMWDKKIQSDNVRTVKTQHLSVLHRSMLYISKWFVMFLTKFQIQPKQVQDI